MSNLMDPKKMRKAVRAAAFLRQARRDADRLEREGQPWAVAHAHQIRAAIAGVVLIV